MKQAAKVGGTATPRSFVDSILDLLTAKGVILILYLSVLTGISVVSGTAVHGFVPGVVLTVTLVAGTVFEYKRRSRVDSVAVVTVVATAAYTALEYIDILQEVWFPVAVSVSLLATAGYESWREGFENTAEFVENLDIVGLHGGVLLLLYAILLAGAPLDFIYAPVFPAVLLFFAVSLVVTTVAYATRSPSVESDELHHKLVSVVSGLEGINESEERQELARHVLAVAQALTGVKLPSRVSVNGGYVPVVLPVSGTPYRSEGGLSTLSQKLEEAGITGYAVDDGDVLLVKSGTPTLCYLSDEDEYRVPQDLSDDRFSDAVIYSAPFSFIDSVESLVQAPEATEDETASGEMDTEQAETEAETGRVSGKEGDEREEPATLDIGDDEIDLDEMFEKADEMFD